MFPLNYALAVALIAGPCPDDFDSLDSIRPTVQAVAVAWELLDPREQRYVFTRHEDLVADCTLLRRRYCDLRDAPPLCDCMRFPDRTLINELLAFNRAYRQHFDSRQNLDRTYWWELREAVQEADCLYQIWDTARDARCDYYYITVRRQALKKLREMVGFEAYSSGCLPPHVPVWRFCRLD